MAVLLQVGQLVLFQKLMVTQL